MSERDMWDIWNGEPEDLLDIPEGRPLGSEGNPEGSPLGSGGRPDGSEGISVTDFDTDEEILAKIRRYTEGNVALPHGYKPLPDNLKSAVLWILEHGHLTTDEWSIKLDQYRSSARVHDLRKFIPIDAESRTTTKKAKKAIYRIDIAEIRKMGCILRKPKLVDKLKKDERLVIIHEHGDRCSFCGNDDLPKLQVDHGVPNEINGDDTHYLVACPSCNTKKRTACKKCPNFNSARSPDVCYSEKSKCFWACRTEEAHTHVATRPERQVQIALTSPEDIALFDACHGINLRDALLRGLQSLRGNNGPS